MTYALVVAQVALSMVLLVNAGLLQRTVEHLQHVDVGFEASRLLLVNVSPPLNSYDRTRVLQLYARLVDRLTRVPGVVRATLSRPAPLSGAVVTAPFIVDGRIPPDDGRADRVSLRRIRWMMVDPNFFDTWGIPVVAGRAFTSTDVADAPPVVIVNEAAAREMFPGDSAIGHRMSDSPGASGTGRSSASSAMPDTTAFETRTADDVCAVRAGNGSLGRTAAGDHRTADSRRSDGGRRCCAATPRATSIPMCPSPCQQSGSRWPVRSAREELFAGAYTSAAGNRCRSRRSGCSA